MRIAPALIFIFVLGWEVHAGCVPSLDLGAGAAAAWSGGEGGGELSRVRGRLGAACSDDGYGFEGAYELLAAWSEYAKTSIGGTPGLRLADLRHDIAQGGDFAAAQNLDRLNVSVAKGDCRLIAGRQAIGHGSGKFFNPSDIFAPANPRATWSEYKGGVDALRLTKRIGSLSEVEAYAVASGRSGEDAFYLARARTSAGKADFSAYAGSTYGAPTLGLDTAFDLGGAGCYIDAISRFDQDPSKTLRMTAGAGMRLLDDFDVFGEYYFNGPGSGGFRGQQKGRSSREWKNGETFVAGRNYLAGGFSYSIHPLASMGANFVLNAADGSILLLPSLEWSATEKLTLVFGLSAGFGDSAKSEFGGVPDFAFAEARLNL